ncbi:MAG TPA: FMN-binding protein [Gammaproteobacteria bacterium]|nr:FMN-binding protein [Gammaproteobacteria bacterium]
MHKTLAGAALTAVALLLPCPSGAAGPEEGAVRAAFPGADRIERDTLFLSHAEQERLRQRARAPVDSRLFPVFEAYQGDRLLGYGFIDQRTVRTKLATFLVALGPDGAVRKVRVLGWIEPPDYRPGERWLDQFEGQELSGSLRLGGAIQGMSGASLSSRTFTDGVRRILALYRVKLAERE